MLGRRMSRHLGKPMPKSAHNDVSELGMDPAAGLDQTVGRVGALSIAISLILVVKGAWGEHKVRWAAELISEIDDL
jgi:hypothetical protein